MQGGGGYGSVTGTSNALLINYVGRLGRGFPIDRQTMLTPYLELGRHEWDRGVNYGENYVHYWYGFGLLAQFSPASASRLVLSLNAMVGDMFGSYIIVNSGTGLSGFAGSLGDSMMWRVGVLGDYALTQRIHANLGLDYTGFSYGMSALYPVGGNLVAWEPDSTTYYTTLRAGLGVAF